MTIMGHRNDGIEVTVISEEGGIGMTARNSNVATRCASCGRMSVMNGLCGTCGAGFQLPSRQGVIVNAPDPITRQSSNTLFSPGPSGPIVAQARQNTNSGMSRRAETRVPPSTTEVSGRVIIVRQAPHEPMDFDPWRWIAIPVWGLVLLMAPVVIGIVVWQLSGFLPALAAFIVSLLVLRFIFSDRLIQSWHLTAALNGRHIVEPMPVLMARLRLHDDREIQLRLKGQLHGGTLMEGDRIRAKGAWRRGVFRVGAITCERTGATIEPRQPNAETLAIIGSFLLMFGVLWLVHDGVPWVKLQVDELRSSIVQPELPNIDFQTQ